MKTEFMGYEDPSLTVLFGDDVQDNINAVAAQTGLSPETVRKTVAIFAPEILGEDEEKLPFGSKFGSVVKTLSEAAPNIAAAIRGQSGISTGAVMPAQEFDPKSLIIPGVIAAALLFVLLKK